MADELGVSRASIIRWAAELVRLGVIDSTRRGSTSNRYQVKPQHFTQLKSCGKLWSRATSDVANCNNVGAPVLLTEPRESEPKQASPAAPVENCERKPPDSERESGNRESPFRGKIPDLSAAEMMPPPTIRSEAGREMPNPDYFRVQQALRRARDRIRAARSPEAYVRAIVWREARAG